MEWLTKEQNVQLENLKKEKDIINEKISELEKTAHKNREKELKKYIGKYYKQEHKAYVIYYKVLDMGSFNIKFEPTFNAKLFAFLYPSSSDFFNFEDDLIMYLEWMRLPNLKLTEVTEQEYNENYNKLLKMIPEIK